MRWCHPLCNSAHGLSVSSGPFMHLPNDISKVSSDHRCPPLYPIVGRHWVTRDSTYSRLFARVAQSGALDNDFEALDVIQHRQKREGTGEGKGNEKIDRKQTIHI